MSKLRTTSLVVLPVLIACFSWATLGQTPAPGPVSSISPGTADEKSQQIINQAIEVLGGANYLNVKNAIGRGFYTPIAEGGAGIPSRFLDYIVYPDRERTEFVSSGIRTINTNNGDTGWIFDGAVKTINDQTETQVNDFKQSMRTSVENLLRGWWQKEGAKVVYVARREAGLAKRNDAIRLTYPNGFWIEYEFGARDHLPAKVIFKRTRKNPDTGDQVETTEEDQFLRFIMVDGINAIWVIDHFIDGKQSTRINYEQVQYNQKIADSLFAKPENVKAIK